MTENRKAQTDLPRILPVFPLPNTVLFPLTLLPLHIFEPRYRTMVRDVKAGSGMIVISRMVGDGFDSLGTVGCVRALVALEDGRFNLMLEGTQRVSMVETPCDTPYRQVLVEPRPEHTDTDDPAVVEQAKLELIATLGLLLKAAQAEVPVVLNQELPFDVLVNKACAGLPIAASARQRLLALDDLLDRQRGLSEHLVAVIESIVQTSETDPGGSTLLN
jgi:Lon protease-like protein